MADAYRFVEPKDPFDSTSVLWIKDDGEGNPTKIARRGGLPVELTKEEFDNWSERFTFEKASQSDVKGLTSKALSGDPAAVAGAEAAQAAEEAVADDGEEEPIAEPVDPRLAQAPNRGAGR